MEVEVNKVYKYRSIGDNQPVDVIVIQMRKNKDGSIRVEICRDLINRTNPFWVWVEQIKMENEIS
jgi:hypothetical protein